MLDRNLDTVKHNTIFPEKKGKILAALQSDILRLQGHKTNNNLLTDLGLWPIKDSFPNSSFPTGAIHEFLFSSSENRSASGGFMAGLLSSLAESNGVVLWISASRKLFPPALKAFRANPERYVFIDVQNEKDVLWAMNEALKCSAISAVVGEMKEISFKASRRLQLAAEQSNVTGFVIHCKYHNPNTTVCASRWKITPLPSEPMGEMPGIGHPKWRVELLRVRNGKPGAWEVQWVNKKFTQVHYGTEAHIQEQKWKVG